MQDPAEPVDEALDLRACAAGDGSSVRYRSRPVASTTAYPTRGPPGCGPSAYESAGAASGLTTTCAPSTCGAGHPSQNTTSAAPARQAEPSGVGRGLVEVQQVELLQPVVRVVTGLVRGAARVADDAEDGGGKAPGGGQQHSEPPPAGRPER